jgi:hypothetical protein
MFMMARLWLLALMLTTGGYAFSQFNDSTHYYVKYASTGVINRTDDAKSYVLTNALNFQVNQKKVSVYSNNSWIYGRQGSGLTNNDFNSVLNVDFLKDLQKLYYWGLVSFTSSYSLKINYQFQAGGGIGYNFINKEKVEIVVSDGLLYETSDLELPSGLTDKYQTVRNSLRIKHRLLINNLISLEGAHYWQPSLKDVSDYIIRSNTSLSIKLRKWLSLTTSLFYNKINRTSRENLLFNFGLTAEKYF